jgi:hypothetical protein
MLSSLDLTTIDVLILWMREIMTGGNPIQITTFNYWCEIHPFMFTVVKITSMKHLMLLKVEAPNEALLLLLFQATICLQREFDPFLTYASLPLFLQFI